MHENFVVLCVMVNRDGGGCYLQVGAKVEVEAIPSSIFAISSELCFKSHFKMLHLGTACRGAVDFPTMSNRYLACRENSTAVQN